MKTIFLVLTVLLFTSCDEKTKTISSTISKLKERTNADAFLIINSKTSDNFIQLKNGKSGNLIFDLPIIISTSLSLEKDILSKPEVKVTKEFVENLNELKTLPNGHIVETFIVKKVRDEYNGESERYISEQSEEN